MQIETDKIHATKKRDVYRVRIENKTDYLKVKWMLSRIPITYAIDESTHTLYFLGKTILD